MSCQIYLKMHFCSCDSGMSLILEVDVAVATETSISILLFRDAKHGIYSLIVKPKMKMCRHWLNRLMNPAAFP